jgi:S-adenosylmethionine:tRNA ribosyltransferase-isomerase
MRVSDFHYDLPDELIARRPAAARSSSRLFVVGEPFGHRIFSSLPEILRAGDLLVFNDTRVIPARLRARKAGTGGLVEILLERLLDGRRILAQLRSSKPTRPGAELQLLDHAGAEMLVVRVLARHAGFFEIEFPPECDPLSVMHAIGHVPLPPYVDRPDDHEDRERYQTVYARQEGSVAAPTAGLHFDPPLLDALAAAGVRSAFLTLHVGAGTFQPLRCETVAEHRMHSEYIDVPEDTCRAVDLARREGRRVVAVGTTSLRALESAASAGELRAYRGQTSIFIYPGYRFRAVDALITNFHLPGSTLMMLVCAFGGTERVLAAYRDAVAQRYRFYSYGDAMFLECATGARAGGGG